MSTPPVTRWGQVWRYGLVLVVSLFSWSTVAGWQWEHARWWFVLDVMLGLAAAVLTWWRRRSPVVVALLTNAVSGVSWTSGGPALLALFSLSTRRRWREILPVALVGISMGLLAVELDPGASDELPWLMNVALLVAIMGVTVGWGMYVGSRRELLATLRERAETAEATQAARIAQARLAERSSIAREMHDVLAHRISIVSMHAAALSYREGLAPEQVQRAATTIEESSRMALVELREILGVLRAGPGDAEPEPPQPVGPDIVHVIEQFKSAGMNLTSQLNVDLSALPDSTARTAHRIVQEGLTNAQKHAPGTRVMLSVVGSPTDGLEIHIVNWLPTGQRQRNRMPNSGLGLIGLEERTELVGGRLDRSMDAEHHELRVWLPWAT